MPEPYWDGAPLRPNRLPVPVVRVPASVPLYAIPLGPHVGVWLHWVGSRTRPCVKDACPLCDTLPAQWAGYLPALVYRSVPHHHWQASVLHVTENAAPALGPDPRGEVFEFTREGKRPNGRVIARRTERLSAKGMVLPPPFDVQPILKQIWGWGPRKPRPDGQGEGGEGVSA